MAEKPYGLESRVAWTTSRVVGSPDPPLPFRAVQAFTQLKLVNPMYLISEPGTRRMLIVEQGHDEKRPGRIRRVAFEPEVSESETLLELNYLIYGLTFHPDFARNGYIYVMSSGPLKERPMHNRISRFTIQRAAPFHIAKDSELVIIEWESNGHNGGDLGFGPDGMLYVPTGDGTSDSDPDLTGQSMNDLLAAMLRIDVDHPDKDKPYSIPRDNPFVNLPDARGEVWAYGFRNPWRMSFDQKTGQLWVGNNGQDVWEQVFLVRRGDNFGWSVYEGGHPFRLERKLGPTPHVKPAVDHPHSEARSLTGGVVYYGQKYPEIQGAFIYGDYSTGRIWGVRHDNTRVTYHRELADTSLQVAAFGLDPDGELIVVDHGGGLYRLEPTPPPDPSVKFPTRLSETGLFQSTAENRPHAALIPYSVNAPLWSDGALKERFIALPELTQIEFTGNRGWRLPEGAVLVKTFSLELEAGKPESQRRIETRLLTRQQGEWQGYTYLWDDAQTDATLVASAGLDREFTIRDPQAPGGQRKQTWHYPSRAECMVCHSRAAAFVLGVTTHQMNKEHDYGGVRDNQLRTLEHLGVFTGKKAKKKGANVETVLPKRPHEYPHLVDPYDKTQDLDARARSYIHANCSSCHVEAGGGNSDMQFEYETDRGRAKMYDESPRHQKFGLADARIIAVGSPERSVLLHRVATRGPGQMPPLATSLVDQPAVDLLRDWIKQLPPDIGVPIAPR